MADTLGRVPEAEAPRLRAIRSDPMNAGRYWDLAGTLYSAAKYADGHAQMRRYMDLMPASRKAHNFTGLLTDPLFDSLAADPRFNALLARMKLPGRDAFHR